MSGGGQAPQPYQPTNQAGADQTMYGGIQSLSQGGQQLQQTAVPGFQNIYSNVQNNPYYPGAQASAGNVAAGGQNLYNMTMPNAQTLSQEGQNLGQYGNQIIQTAFDPQRALYNQQRQLNTDQSNAIASMYGVGQSPYGAGLADQSNQNFNIAWQNAQQQRQNAGIAALGNLYGTQADMLTGAQNLGNAGLQTLQNTGQFPSATYLSQQNATEQALNDLVSGTTGAYGLTGQATQGAQNYLGVGQQASQNALKAWQAQQQADNSFWGAIGSTLGAVGQIGLGIATGGASLPFTMGMSGGMGNMFGSNATSQFPDTSADI